MTPAELAGESPPGRFGLQVFRPVSMTLFVETPSFTFRLERVRTVRERAEERAREDLANELRLRVRGEALLREATHAVATARSAGLDTVRGDRTTSSDLLAVQAYLERAERNRREAALDLDRQDAEVNARREVLAAAARDRQAIEKLKERQQSDHDRAWARRSQNILDELALSIHRRGGQAA
jgi:flagellar FliJ protein